MQVRRQDASTKIKARGSKAIENVSAKREARGCEATENMSAKYKAAESEATKNVRANPYPEERSDKKCEPKAQRPKKRSGPVALEDKRGVSQG